MKTSKLHPFHLCQPDGDKSCGACCGLYNCQDHSRSVLTDLLQRRTELFQASPKDGRLLEYRESLATLPPNSKLLETIHNCEFLGFIDPAQRRVGCLLHSSLHGGDDMRVHSFYGPELCGGHFCPSHSYLTRAEQAAVIGSISDWYLYGLAITDIDLVKEFFHHVQARLGDPLRAEKLEYPDAKKTLGEFFQLKEGWKFSSAGNRLGKYYFSYDEYRIAHIEYGKKWQMKPSRFDKILVSLSSEFAGPEEIMEAESIVEEKMQAFIQAYQKNS